MYEGKLISVQCVEISPVTFFTFLFTLKTEALRTPAGLVKPVSVSINMSTKKKGKNVGN